MGEISSGSWLTRERILRIAFITAMVSVAIIAFLFGSSTGTLDLKGRPLGTDFSQVWVAGNMVLEGNTASVWDWNAHFAAQRSFHGGRLTEFYGWHYPPPFLLLAAMLATLPYLVALAAWQLSTLGALAHLVHRYTGRPESWLLVPAAPVTLICLLHGHNGFLTALLLGGGLILLERRPLLAGLLLGCLVYKPQFALVLPLVLLAGWHWRAIAGAGVSSLGLIVITYALWGWPVWQAFLDSLPLTREIVIEQGRTGWEKIMSPFAAVRSLGGSVPAAYMIHGTIAALAIAAAVWLSKNARADLRNAGVVAAVLIATPYVLDYDLVVLLVGIAFVWRDGNRYGWLPFDKSALAIIWLAPLFARNIAAFTFFPLGLATILLALWIAVRRHIKALPSRHSHAVSVR